MDKTFVVKKLKIFSFLLNKKKHKKFKKNFKISKLWFVLSVKFKSFRLKLGTSLRYKLNRKHFFYPRRKRNFPYHFFYKKPRVLVNKYLFSKTNRLVKKKYQFPFLLNRLTFTQPSIMSTVKHTLINPFFGSVRKGGFKGFYQTLGIKEKPNLYLVSRWYRLQRFAIYQKYWEQREKMRAFIFGFINSETFLFNVKHQKNYIVFCHFFIRKRWHLLDVVDL